MAKHSDPPVPKRRATRQPASTLAKSAWSMPAIAKLPPRLHATGHLAIQLASRYPIPLVGVFWLTIMLLALTSMDSLVSPGLKDHSRLPSEQRVNGAGGDAADLAAISPQVIQQKSRIPLWLFGAIALTGAGSAILLATQLPRSAPRQRAQPTRRIAAAPKPVPAQASPRTASMPVAPPPVAQPWPAALQPSRPGHSQPHRAAPHSAAVALPKLAVAPPVTTTPTTPSAVPAHIVSAQDTHPLDWPEGSLVDAMDLRKQRSLASWLNQPPPDQSAE